MITASAAAVMIVVVAVIVVVSVIVVMTVIVVVVVIVVMVMVMLMAVVVVVMVMLSTVMDDLVLSVMADLVLSVMADLIGHLHPRCLVNQPLCCMLVAVEDDILHTLQQLRLDLVIDLEHGWIHDRHVQSSLDSVIEERRMHGLSDCIVSAE